MGIGDITDAVARQIEAAQSGVERALLEPVVRLGVTGLSRAGKSVFITSLVANLLNRGRMPQLAAEAEGRILSAFLQPQPNDAVARFDYETHLAALTGPAPHWPDSTRTISQLRLSLKLRPQGLLSGVTGPKTVHLDIVDYPGEWLLDLPLMSQSYADWSAATLDQARGTARAALARPWLDTLGAADPAAMLDETTAAALAGSFTNYLRAAQDQGLSAAAPGRFLLPGDLAGSPALTFTPLPKPADRPGRNSLYAAFEHRFDAYKRIVVKPFFRDHFAALDRQIVLVDLLSAIAAGPQALEEQRQAMTDILECFRPGRNSWLAPLLGKRVEKILFAATKADHLHHAQHDRLAAITQAMLDEARRRADFKGAKTQGMALAALRATTEQTVTHDGQTLQTVRGALMDGRNAAMHAGELPDDPSHLLTPARKGAEHWLDADFSDMKFAPPKLTLAPGEGPPHIRLDRAAQFLLGDKL
ncbi:YcjX family GTP-binding protein [Halovulum sp. GXIMD14793]